MGMGVDWLIRVFVLMTLYLFMVKSYQRKCSGAKYVFCALPIIIDSSNQALLNMCCS